MNGGRKNPSLTPKNTGVPNGAARQNTRSTGQNSAGWEIEHLSHALAGNKYKHHAG